MSDNATKDATVESATAAMQAATLDDAAASASASEGRRLYIGNLAYSTTETELKDFFKDFTVESVSIPTNPRTGRAVGYAFVDVASKEDADKAINTLSGQEVLERKVSVQVARKPGETGVKPKIKKEFPETTAPVVGETSADAEDGEKTPSGKRTGRGGHRGRGRGRGRGGIKSRSDRNEGSEEKITNPLPLTEATNAGTEEKPEAGSASESKPSFRKKTTRGPPEDGVPSNTKVMVANLPYELTEDQLKELFKDYEPESAKIALRPIPRFMIKKLQQRGEARKGRGFGFVTLSSHEMQQKAVDEMNDKTVDGRIIAVKVAIDNPKIDGDEFGEGAGSEKENGVAEATQ